MTSFCTTCNIYSNPTLCTQCISKLTEQTNKSLEEKNKELHDLQSRLAFLRLQPLCQPPDDFRKWDTAIIVKGKTDERLHAHRIILSSKSSVFSTMFDIKMSEEETGTIYIDDATLPVIRAMIDFCYNAEIDFTDDVTAEEVMKVAHKYQIALLQSICERHLIQTLNNNNLPKRLRLAKTFDAKVLAGSAADYFKTHFDEVLDDVLAELC